MLPKCPLIGQRMAGELRRGVCLDANFRQLNQSMANSTLGDVQDTALQATKDNGLIVDFTLGPNQGAGVSRIGGISSDFVEISPTQ